MSKNQPTNDLPGLLNHSKSQYSILDKSTGQVLGYALMTTDQSVPVDNLKFVSIPWPEGAQPPQDAGPGDAQLLLPPHCPSPGPESMQGNLISDLDLSQGSSMNETLEEDLSSNEVKNAGNLLQTSPSDQNGNNYETCPDSPKSHTSIYSSISASPTATATNLIKTPDHHPIQIQSAVSRGANPSSSETLVSSPKHLPPTSKPVTFPPSSSVTVKHEFPNKVESLAQSLASDIIAAKLKKENQLAKPSHVSSVKESPVLNRKRNFVENVDENYKEKKIKVEIQLQRATKADFDPFIELVDEGKDKKYQRVKCLLCGDGKLLSLGNFSRHIKAIHEPPIKCDNCGKEFSGEQFKVHMKKCVWQNLDFVEKTGKFEVSESKVVRDDAIPVPLPVTNHGHVASPESPVNTSTSSVSTSATETSSGISVKCNDDVSTNWENHPTSASHEVSQLSTSEGGDWVSLVLTSSSVEGVRMRMKIQKGAKVKKVMRSFGNRHNLEWRKKLRFLLGSRELTGEEKVEELDGNEIDVFGEIVPMKI